MKILFKILKILFVLVILLISTGYIYFKIPDIKGYLNGCKKFEFKKEYYIDQYSEETRYPNILENDFKENTPEYNELINKGWVSNSGIYYCKNNYNNPNKKPDRIKMICIASLRLCPVY